MEHLREDLPTSSGIILAAENDPSPWILWKWVTHIYIMTFTWECVITLIFWTLLYPGYRDTDTMDFWTTIDHSVPLTLLFIDWMFNRIYIEPKQWWIVALTFLVYGFINITVTKVSGTPVYGPMPWDSPLSWVEGCMMLPIAIFMYFFTWGITYLKFSCGGMLDKSVIEDRAAKVGQF